MSIHSGHRERVKKRYRQEGLDGFEQHQVLELLLFYCVPRQDTNPLAHRLMENFGSVKKVLRASKTELMKVEGVSDGVADFLLLFGAVDRYCCVEDTKDIKILRTIEDCGNFLIPYYRRLTSETVFLLCLDAKCKVLSCKKLGEGSINSAAVPIRRVVEAALEERASVVVLSHNHPSGVAVPSGDDVQTTRRLAVALDAVGVELLDHIIVAEGDYVSLSQSGYYDPENCRLLV